MPAAPVATCCGSCSDCAPCCFTKIPAVVLSIILGIAIAFIAVGATSPCWGGTQSCEFLTTEQCYTYAANCPQNPDCTSQCPNGCGYSYGCEPASGCHPTNSPNAYYPTCCSPTWADPCVAAPGYWQTMIGIGIPGVIGALIGFCFWGGICGLKQQQADFDKKFNEDRNVVLSNLSSYTPQMKAQANGKRAAQFSHLPRANVIAAMEKLDPSGGPVTIDLDKNGNIVITQSATS